MQKTNSRFLNFLKRNAFYLVLSLCIIAVGVSLILVFTNNSDSVDNLGDANTQVQLPDTPSTNDTPTSSPTEDKPVVEPVVETITFTMPVLNPVSIVEYSEQMVFNSTLKRYSSHQAVDFIVEEGTKVYAVYGGKIASVESTLLTGTTITIDHGNGLTTIYNSLIDGDSVTVGQTVKKGEVIGEVGATNRQEADKGAHLHFQVKEDGNLIDPEKYLTFNKK